MAKQLAGIFLVCFLITSARCADAAPSSEAGDVRNMRAMAMRQAAQGLLEQAISSYDSAVSLGETAYGRDSTLVADMYFEEGLVALNGDRYPKAEACLKKAVQLNPNADEVGLKLADFYNLRVRYADSKRIVKKVLSRHPDNAEARQILAMAYQGEGNVAKADSECYLLRQVAESKPVKPEVVALGSPATMAPAAAPASPATVAAAVPAAAIVTTGLLKMLRRPSPATSGARSVAPPDQGKSQADTAAKSDATTNQALKTGEIPKPAPKSKSSAKTQPVAEPAGAKLENGKTAKSKTADRANNARAERARATKEAKERKRQQKLEAQKAAKKQKQAPPSFEDSAAATSGTRAKLSSKAILLKQAKADRSKSAPTPAKDEPSNAWQEATSPARDETKQAAASKSAKPKAQMSAVDGLQNDTSGESEARASAAPAKVAPKPTPRPEPQAPKPVPVKKSKGGFVPPPPPIPVYPGAVMPMTPPPVQPQPKPVIRPKPVPKPEPEPAPAKSTGSTEDDGGDFLLDWAGKKKKTK